ncbi:MAG: CoA-binding protein [Desulfovibrio sp.]|nr:MAG: CoA-binding protein [Desulfovibrio sp.]
MDYTPDLTPLFAPKRIAVVGASSTPGKIGNIIMQNLIDAGYEGEIIPVNRKGDEILGLPVTHDVKDIQGPLDLGVIVIPPKFVVPTLEDLAALPVKAVIIITAGFKEVGKDGYYLEEQVKEICTKAGIALLGPNCLGMINTASKVNASFAVGQPQPGKIAFFSQSGALCVSILDWALGQNIGFSSFVSLGNKALLDESHMLEHLVDDPATKVILGYIEGVENGVRFMRAARKVTPKKPVVLIKSGTTSAGAQAASSHTGAIAGSDQAYTAAFRQSGIIRAHDVKTLFNLAESFSSQPLPKGPNLAIVTNSGGPGILAADACGNSDLMMARLSAASVDKLKEFLPPYASLYNPIDIIGDADAERYAKTLEIVLADERVHSVMVLLSPTATVQVEETARAVIAQAKNSAKPIFACFMGDVAVREGRRLLQEASVPCFSFPEPAIESINTMYQYFETINKPAAAEICFLRHMGKAKKIIDQAKAAGQTEIVEFQAQGVLQAYDLPQPKTILARTSDEAVKAAKDMGYPVVLKIASPQISHKSDVGGVKVNLRDEDAVRAAYLDITSRAARMRTEAFISGCLVQEMAPKGSREVIVGFKRDPQFGPLILFGLGGIYVEVLKDVSFRLAPLSISDAQEMVREIKSFPLLRGVRGDKPVNFQAIEDVLLVMSQFALDFPEVYEAEFNPVLVSETQALVADVRVILAEH